MAKIVSSSVESQTVGLYYPLIRILIIGLASGIVFWLMSIGISRFIINPITCDSLSKYATCLNSLTIAGNISTVLIAVIGMVAMVRLRIARPLVVAVATGAILWNLSKWTDGLSLLEVISWSAALYALSFLLFSWLTRYEKIIPVLIFSTIIVIIANVVTVL